MDATRDDDVTPTPEQLLAALAQVANGWPTTHPEHLRWLASHLPELIADKARTDLLGALGVLSVVFYDGSQLNCGSLSFRATIDLLRPVAAHLSGERADG